MVIVREFIALSHIAERKGDLTLARSHAAAARSIADQLGPGAHQSLALQCGAKLAKKMGEYDNARDLYERALAQESDHNAAGEARIA